MVANDDDCAQLDVPNSEPVIPPLVILILPERIFNEPVFVIDPLETRLLMYPVLHILVLTAPKSYALVNSGYQLPPFHTTPAFPSLRILNCEL